MPLKLGTCVGEGGFGAVHIGWWQGQRVAVKRLFLRGQDSLIHKEIELIKSLRHRHIIQFLDVETIDGCFVLITDFADGGSLQELIVQDSEAADADPSGNGLLDWGTKSRLAQEMASGLVYIHSKKIIHRDLKSANVLLSKHLEVRLCDFGLARVKTTTASQASNGKMEGTLRWMAPELLTIKPKYTTKSDMYALGMVLWEMAARCTVPFQEQANGSMIADHVRSGGREDIPEETPDAFRLWIESCWAQDPAQRPEAEEMVEDDIDGFERRQSGSEAGTVSISASFVRMGLTGNQSGISDIPSSSSLAVSQLQTSSQSAILPNSPPSLATKPPRRPIPSASTDSNLSTTNMPSSTSTTFSTTSLGSQAGNSILNSWSSSRANSRPTSSSSSSLTSQYISKVPKTVGLARQGNKEAQFTLGNWYLNGQEGLAVDFVEAEKWLVMAASDPHGHIEAIRLLGAMNDEGLGLPRNSQKAFEYYSRAASAGDTHSQREVAAMYREGRAGVVAQTPTMAFQWMHKAAQQGDVEAENALGWFYRTGFGVEAKDASIAAAWFYRAADKGHREAQNNLGCLYHIGLGVDRTPHLAAFYYREAAEQGHIEAHFRMYKLHALAERRRKQRLYGIRDASMLPPRGLSSSTTPEDEQHIYFEQCLKMAEEDPATLFQYGEMHELGDYGAVPDEEMALLLYQAAAVRGYAPAIRAVGA
ncbi:hypothetical protein DFQ27_009942, partial [Actinomortierella ambigua]